MSNLFKKIRLQNLPLEHNQVAEIIYLINLFVVLNKYIPSTIHIKTSDLYKIKKQYYGKKYKTSVMSGSSKMQV
jgi:hypothetical protein